MNRESTHQCKMINIQCKKTKATFKHQSQKSFEGIDFFEI
jgi:hypothetical protein